MYRAHRRCDQHFLQSYCSWWVGTQERTKRDQLVHLKTPPYKKSCEMSKLYIVQGGWVWISEIPNLRCWYSARKICIKLETKFHLDEVALCRLLCCRWKCSFHGQRFDQPWLASCEKNSGSKEKFPKAPFRLRLFVSVVKSKKDWEGLCSQKFVIFVETVGCCDHPGAPDLCEMKIRGSTVKPTRVPLQDVLM